MANKSQDPHPKTVHEAIEGMTPRLNPDVAGEIYKLQFNSRSPRRLRSRQGETIT